MRGEVAGQYRREGRHVGRRRHDLLGRRAALGLQAREPRRHVEPRVAAAGEVPVDEPHAVLEEAQVVAADVHVEQPVTLELGRVSGVGQRRQADVEPGLVAQSETQERRAV